jgi:hypothetical protein
MGVTRSVPASPGYSELRTYGCRECWVWVTEGRAPEDEREGSFLLRKWSLCETLFGRASNLLSLTHVCPVFALFDPN